MACLQLSHFFRKVSSNNRIAAICNLYKPTRMEQVDEQRLRRNAAAVKRRKTKILQKLEVRASALNRVSADFWPMVAEVVLKDLLARAPCYTDINFDLGVQLQLAQQLKTVSLLYCVNKACMAMIRAVYKSATRVLRQQAAVRQACYDEITRGFIARWEQDNPGMDWRAMTREEAVQLGWNTMPPSVYLDPLDRMLVIMDSNDTVCESIMPDGPGRGFRKCKPFDKLTSKLCPYTFSSPAQSDEDKRIDVFQWVQEGVNNTCNVCKRVVKVPSNGMNIFGMKEGLFNDPWMGGDIFGRICKPCMSGIFVEISTLCTVYGIYKDSPSGVDWQKLRLSREVYDMKVKRVRQIDQRASMLNISKNGRGLDYCDGRGFQFVDMRSVSRAVSTAEDPTGEATLQSMARLTQDKRSAVVRILWQTRMLRLRRLWGVIRHKKNPDETVITNNRIVLQLKDLEVSACPNQLFATYCNSGVDPISRHGWQPWQPSSATVPEAFTAATR